MVRRKGLTGVCRCDRTAYEREVCFRLVVLIAFERQGLGR